MKPIAKKDCKINNVYYDKGDEIKVDNKGQLLKLIEKGFIEPMSMKDIQNFDKKIKEEKRWD